MTGDVVVIGSGAGGAVTALALAERGLGVLVLEEGPRPSLADYGAPSAEAMGRLYRNRGMTPILGDVPIGYVEGRCLGGSTEINSGFWHRTPREVLLRWKAQFDLARPTRRRARAALRVGREAARRRPLRAPPGRRARELFARGGERHGLVGSGDAARGARLPEHQHLRAAAAPPAPSRA